jgi:hypothetical protein
VGAAAVLALETTWFSFAPCTRVVLCDCCRAGRVAFNF